MPRKARKDAPGALHHIICRGIERKKIFTDDIDRNNFIDRLGNILTETQTPCFAWALMSNHIHLLLRTANAPITIIMRRLLTGYAVGFNRRHRRHGHLFQNRYKSILCQEDLYLMELVRYIHLNSLRAALVSNLNKLMTGDERILGDSDFVESVLKKADEFMERKYRLQALGYDFDKVADRVAAHFQLKPAEILLPTKQRHPVMARSLLCFWTIKDLGLSSIAVAGRMGITQPAVSRLAQRGEKVAIDNNLSLENKENSKIV
jgi:REP element-mobilizing transposase RayT